MAIPVNAYGIFYEREDLRCEGYGILGALSFLLSRTEYL
jgi:hypothetical protein